VRLLLIALSFLLLSPLEARPDDGYLEVNLSLDLLPVEFSDHSFKRQGKAQPLKSNTVRLKRISHPGGAQEIGGMVFVKKEGDAQTYAVALRYFKLAVSSPELIAARAPEEIQRTIKEVTEPAQVECLPDRSAEVTTSFTAVPERRRLSLVQIAALDHDSGHMEGLSNWDECSNEQSIKANFKGANCTKRSVSTDFANFLGDKLPACAAQGLATIRPGASLQLPIKMVHNGIAGDEAHRRKGKSNHNLMRAIDLVSLDLTSKTSSKNETVSLDYGVASRAALKEQDGKSLTPTEINQLRFWRTLRNCWIREVRAKQSAECPDNEGCVDWNDRNHRHHLHLSLPLCPNTVGGTTFYTDKVKDRQ
jgi:hypothetical protein